MRRLVFAILLAVAPIDAHWRTMPALAETAEVSAKDAFEAARELGTADAWNAFLANYPTGFYADLARAYIKKLTAGGAVPAPTATPAPRPTPAPTTPAPTASPAPAAPPDAGGKPVGVAIPNPGSIAPTRPGQPAVFPRRPLHGLPRAIQPLLHRSDAGSRRGPSM